MPILGKRHDMEARQLAEKHVRVHARRRERKTTGRKAVEESVHAEEKSVQG
jgi:hypothetical protein